jgi:hypothetical protein
MVTSQQLAHVVVHTPRRGSLCGTSDDVAERPVLAAAGVPGTGLRTLEPEDNLSAILGWTWMG